MEKLSKKITKRNRRKRSGRRRKRRDRERDIGEEKKRKGVINGRK